MEWRCRSLQHLLAPRSWSLRHFQNPNDIKPFGNMVENGSVFFDHQHRGFQQRENRQRAVPPFSTNNNNFIEHLQSSASIILYFKKIQSLSDFLVNFEKPRTSRRNRQKSRARGLKTLIKFLKKNLKKLLTGTKVLYLESTFRWLPQLKVS